MATEKNVGKIVEIKGVVIDAVFTERLPEIYHALSVEIGDGEGSSLFGDELGESALGRGSACGPGDGGQDVGGGERPVGDADTVRSDAKDRSD